MPYTLWSRDQLLGESDFEHSSQGGRRRAGVFRPTVVGGSLLPVLCGMGPAVLQLEAMFRRERLTPENVNDVGIDEIERMFRSSEEGRRVMSYVDQLTAMELELRDPAGEVVETESLAVNDLERLAELAVSVAAARGATGAARQPPPAPRPDQPRYMMSATLRRRRMLRRPWRARAE
jgi:hypothetical protein